MKQYMDKVALPPCLATYGSYKVARFLRFHDGDTFQCDVAGLPDIVGKAIQVRCKRFDTPEIKDPRPEIQALAQKAQAFAETRLKKAKVVTLKDLTRDKYFRLLAEVLVDGKPLADIMIGAGLARPYKGGTKVQDWSDLLK